MLRKNLIFSILIIAVLNLESQEATDQTAISLAYPVYSQYLHNGLIINPAYAGSREVLSIFLSGRVQWMGIDGAPVSQTVSMHSLLRNNRIGLGFSGQFFKYGFSRSAGIFASYAYHLNLESGILSMGLRGGFDMSNTDYSGIVLINPNDPVFAVNDKPYFLPNVGAGVYYYTDRYFAGASVPSFLSYAKNSNGTVSLKTFSDFDLFLTAGAVISVTPGLKFKPSVFIDFPVQKTKKMKIDLNGNFIIRDFLWVGASWRTSEEVLVGILQYQVNPQIMFGYSYDYPVGKMNTYSKGSHEIIFRYEFGYKVNAANPRYF